MASLNNSLLSIGDALSLVFKYISAYDLAFLYFSGDSTLRSRLSKQTQHFSLSYSPYRRIAWPRNFLPLLPALKHFSIGGSTENWYPLVPDIDIRLLPADLISLDLSIANGFLTVVEADTKARTHTLMDFNTRFPHLKHLSWHNQTFDWDDWVPLHRTSGDFTSRLAHPHLRSLSMSVLSFSFEQSSLLPETLEELSITAMTWKIDHGKLNQDFKFHLPPQLKRLELRNLAIGLGVAKWSDLKYLLLDFNSAWMYHDGLASTILSSGCLPTSLESFVLYCPQHAIDSRFVAKLPPDLTELRIYARSVAIDSFGSANGFEKSLPIEKLRILHFCVAVRNTDSDLADSMFFDRMPPKLVEFVVTAERFPHKPKDMQNMPIRLASRRSNPAIITSPYPPSGSFESHLKAIGYPLAQLEYPNSLMDLEESIFNFKSFPKSLTRLSILSHSISPFRRSEDYSSLATYIPNVIDLSLCLDAAFEILRYCAALPLIALQLDVYPGKTGYDPNGNAIDLDLSGKFDLRCFKKLERLCIHPRFIGSQYTLDWLKRLPTTLKDLSFVPYRSTWSDAHLMLQMESWIVFPRVPRGLTRLTGVFSDLHIHNVFGLLPTH